MKTILITGAAGFIGSNLARRLLQDDADLQVVGLDNVNDYYDVRIKGPSGRRKSLWVPTTVATN